MTRALSLPFSLPLQLALRWGAVASLALALALVLGRAATNASAAVEVPGSARILPVTGGASLPRHPHAAAGDARELLGDSLLGTSGRLRVHLMPAAELADFTGASYGSSHGASGKTADVYPVPGGIDGQAFALLAVHDFSLKTGAYVGSYRMGYWPAERRRIRSRGYENPAGFVEVTRANADTRVSDHFLLRDFLTHDQANVWPKYLVLREALLDKLELVLAELERGGHPASHVIVLSGFRTPAYNLALGDASGRARESRHQYGDAADIIIDSDGDGRMDDLDMDGRSDVGDVHVIERAVERVERLHPELVGGLGLYESMGPSGPFAHIDVRGEAARWTSSRTRRSGYSSPGRAAPVSHCQATGASAVLCTRIRRHPPR